MEILKDKEFEAKVLGSKRPVLLEFASAQCIICKLMRERLEAIEKRYGERVDFYRVDVDTSVLAGRYQVKTIPTLVYFKDGKLITRQDAFPGEGEIKEQLSILLHGKKSPRYMDLIKELGELRLKFLNQLDQKIGEEKRILREYIQHIDKFIEGLPKSKMSMLSMIDQLKDSIDAEYVVSKFYAYIGKKSRNGHAKIQFLRLHRESMKHRELLARRLKELTGQPYQPEPSKLSSPGLLPATFSLVGAMETAIAAEEQAFNFYKRARKFADDERDRGLFGFLVKEEKRHRAVLQKELKYLREKEFFKPQRGTDFFTLLDKLWR